MRRRRGAVQGLRRQGASRRERKEGGRAQEARGPAAIPAVSACNLDSGACEGEEKEARSWYPPPAAIALLTGVLRDATRRLILCSSARSCLSPPASEKMAAFFLE